MFENAYLDIHIVQTVPPANMNRDDQGSPKEAMYGGVRRSRVSSQAWKRATRQAFAALPESFDRAMRSRKLVTELANRLAACGVESDQVSRIAHALRDKLGVKVGNKPDETAYLLFFGLRQLDAIVGLVAEDAAGMGGLDDAQLKEAVAKLPVAQQLQAAHPIDVALFGRMVADLPAINVDAAVQVAHALSTHEVQLEFDYYTAVDDANPAEETGAGMIGTVAFNSATLYRYATVGLRQLCDNLDGDPEATAVAMDTFVDAFARSVPSGHQNAFAHRTLPSLVSVMLREDQPVNLVSAFEAPIPTRGGIAGASITALANEHRRIVDQWGHPPTATLSTYMPVPHEADVVEGSFGSSVSFADLRAGAREHAAKWLTRRAAQ
jgi:CRISPR system Cascade subunit CasC